MKGFTPYMCFWISILLMASCKLPEKKAVNKSVFTEPVLAINQGKQVLQNGDLVLRTDDDVVSASLRNFSVTDKSYSHCGIVYYEDSAWYVYHLMAGDENPSDLMERERFESFVSPNRKSRFGIYRYELSTDEKENLQTEVYRFMANHTLFDKDFDLKTDDKLYCAEMVYKGLKTATNDRVILPVTVRKNFDPKRYNKTGPQLKRFEFVALDNLFLNPFCKEIKRFRYPNTSLERE